MGDVGKEVRRLREAKGWGQTKLAAAADMAVSGVSQIENGKRNPNSATLIKLARALGVEVADLFPKGQAPLPSPAALDMEATLDAIRKNLALLETYLENPPSEAVADEAMERFYDLMPKPLEHLSRMNPDEMRMYIAGVRDVFDAQMRMNRRLEPWNIAQYDHLHRDVG